MQHAQPHDRVLELIVGGVAGDDDRGAKLSRRIGEQGVARLAGGGG